MTTCRPFDPDTDYPRLAEIVNAQRVYPRHTTPELLREMEETVSEGQIEHRLVALDQDGRITGYGAASRDASLRAGLFTLTLAVDPACTRLGIGRILYDDLWTFTREHGATRVTARVRDDDPASLRFAEARGFHTERHQFQSHLDVATFDESRFAGVVETVEAAGIRFFTMADAGDTVEARHAFFDLIQRVALDVPGYTDTIQHPPSFEDFSRSRFETSFHQPEWEFIAAGDRWVGLSILFDPDRDGQLLFQNMTGVDRDYRGRKVALALKLLALRYAGAHGVPIIVTNNDALNAPILAINRALGFQPEPGVYRLTLDTVESRG